MDVGLPPLIFFVELEMQRTAPSVPMVHSEPSTPDSASKVKLGSAREAIKPVDSTAMTLIAVSPERGNAPNMIIGS